MEPAQDICHIYARVAKSAEIGAQTVTYMQIQHWSDGGWLRVT